MFCVLASLLFEFDHICKFRLQQRRRTGDQDSNLAFSYRKSVGWFTKLFVAYPVYVTKHLD